MSSEPQILVLILNYKTLQIHNVGKVGKLHIKLVCSSKPLNVTDKNKGTNLVINLSIFVHYESETFTVHSPGKLFTLV